MVKAKKAALGAMVMASFQPQLLGVGQDTVDAQPEVSTTNNARNRGT